MLDYQSKYAGPLCKSIFIYTTIIIIYGLKIKIPENGCSVPDKLHILWYENLIMGTVNVF